MKAKLKNSGELQNIPTISYFLFDDGNKVVDENLSKSELLQIIQTLSNDLNFTRDRFESYRNLSKSLYINTRAHLGSSVRPEISEKVTENG